ncbi:conserved exported hypothetical protein [Flavobacterium sp. 9AF]|uniref:hypothetical protein n=1 Tax=Flavobacterium sp. 9AF TaxID=2653142 RepID=UPI0012EFF04B|nr:hypothetical protein [Flavobacterium sp. 9AF]VXC06407.1 conserved exported hypothetical protein [Flavobacterium sp. 9AF]
MRKTNPKRTLNFYFILCSITFLTVTSCVFTNNQKEESVIKNKKSKTVKDYDNIEAELLAKFNERNVNLITISDNIQNREVPFRIKCLASSLVEEQSKINKVINKITAEKLIIIPNVHIKNNLSEIEKTSNEQVRKIYLETVNRIIKNQIDDLTKLSEKTEDIDFKILALQTIVKLNTSLEKVNQIKNI